MIYLDHNATTPVSAEAFEAMRPYFCQDWGNPSSSYRFGSQVRTAVETAREQVAALIGAYSPEVIFTGCATESNNAAIHAALKARPSNRHVVTSCVEHSSVLSYCQALEQEGYTVTYLPVDREGQLSLTDLENAITDSTAVVSLMWANNETGVVFPIERIGTVCKTRGVLFHTDAVQAAGKLPIDLKRTPVDYLSLAAHKINGPKGVGALFVSRTAPFSAYLHGGHQERGWRGGTTNVPLIIGMGEAAKHVKSTLLNYQTNVAPMRDQLERGILKVVHDVEVNGGGSERLVNTTSISFGAIESEAMLLLLDQQGVCASSGSACLADSDVPSHVIEAMKPGTTAARQSIRFSMGKETSVPEIDEALRIIQLSVATLRGLHLVGTRE